MKRNEHMAVYTQLNCTMQVATDMGTEPGMWVGLPQPHVENFQTAAPIAEHLGALSQN